MHALRETQLEDSLHILVLCSFPFFPDEFSVRFNLSMESSKCFNVSITGDDLPDGSDSLEMFLSLDSNRTQHGIGFVHSRAHIFIGSLVTEGINDNGVLIK